MTEREKLLAEIRAIICDEVRGWSSTPIHNRINQRIAALPFFAPESAPAAGESGELSQEIK
jgi:hypothetical protein